MFVTMLNNSIAECFLIKLLYLVYSHFLGNEDKSESQNEAPNKKVTDPVPKGNLKT